MTDTRRFTVNDRCPWPERIGRTGHVVPPLRPGEYPWDKTPRGELSVWIDDDPLIGGLVDGEDWTCMMPLNALDFEDDQ